MPSFAQAITGNARTIARLSDADLEALMPALVEAREVTARKLRTWLSQVDRDDKYTTATHAQLISSLDRAMREIRTKIYHGAAQDLKSEGADASQTAIDAMLKMARAGNKRFPDAAVPLRLDVAQIVNDNTRNLLGRHASSALRYSGTVGADIRRTLTAGLASGESVGSIVTRLMRKPKFMADRASDSKAAEDIADASFFRSRSDAERLVRTENIHAANAATTNALLGENEDAERSDRDSGDDGGDNGDNGDNSGDNGDGEGGWLLKWNSTFDKRTCEVCEDLDGEIREPGEEFDDGVYHPPAHPSCRCATVPWREEWSED